MQSRVFQSVMFAAFMAITCLALPTHHSCAQGDFPTEGGFPNFPIGGSSDEPATWDTQYTLNPGGDVGVLKVAVALGEGWHVYSTTQAPGGPLKTKLKIESPKAVQLAGAFRPDHEPKTSVSDIYDGLTIEEFSDSVTWSVPIIVPPDYRGEIKVAVDGLTCTDAGKCVPFREVLVAQYTPPATVAQESQGVAQTQQAAPAKGMPGKLAPLNQKPFREKDNPVQWTSVASKAIPTGGRGVIEFTATPDKTFHVYPGVADAANFSTNFVVTKKSGLKIAAPSTPSEVVVDHGISFHEGAVTWTLPIEVPAGTPAGKHDVEGFVVYQACTSNSCHPPSAVKFKTTIAVGDAGNEAVAVKLVAATRAEGLDAAAETKWVDKLSAPAANPPAKSPAPADQSADHSTAPSAATPADSHATASDTKAAEKPKAISAISSAVAADSPEAIAEMAKLYNPDEKIRYLTYSEMAANPVGSGGVSSGTSTTFWSAMIGAFIGGILLNLMPCVFPVLGLKVMGFVKQAGSDPAKIRKHGLAFTAGLVVAMWVLAGIILAVKLSLGQDINWGAQMGNPYFVCSMIVLLFLLGLNMAGVFEFGTSMTRVGGSIQGKEGYSASFLSGVLTTLVATPCSGPFLGAAMSYTLAQTAGVAMFLFTIFALGIALPYLLLCFFPVLINKLPRPGAWMETFKVTMAFALFATVAFFMRAFGNQTGVSGLTWLAMALVVIGLAAFYYGNYTAPHIPETKRRLFGYAMPLAIACVGAWMCYGAASEIAPAGSSSHAGGLAWQKWNPGKVAHSLAKNKESKRPIWVEYTAHW